MKNIIKNIILPVVLLIVITGCSDEFLNRYPDGTYTEESFYTSNEALRAICDPLYNRAWFGFHERSMLGLGSLRANDAYNAYFLADFTRFRTTALTDEVGKSWSSLYAVVSMSNAVIDGVKNKCGPDVTQDAKDKALGEAYLMRATAYFFGVRIFGAMILSEDNVELIRDPIRPLNPEEDIFKFIIRDLRKACELLPPTTDPGRASVWGAKAMLAKVLLAWSGWGKTTRDEAMLEECIKLCEDVINNSGASLIRYEDLFKYQFNINSETLLAMRWAPLGPWGTQNTLISDLSWGVVCDVSCWNNDMCATIDMIELYNEDINKDLIRRKATFFIPGEHYDYILSASGGYTHAINADGEGFMRVKKQVVGSQEDNDNLLGQQNSPLHTPILRFAEVLLTHAEACLGNADELTSGRGLESFNKIRKRAEVSEKDKITFMDLMKERRIEFCMEFQTQFDMITWYRWKPEYMLEFFNNKMRRGYLINNGGIRMRADGGIDWWVYNHLDEDGERIWNSVEGYTSNNYDPVEITKDNIFIPYPERDRLQNPYFSQPPVPYDFNKYDDKN